MPTNPAEDWWDVAQICANGHMVNPETLRSPDYNKAFCSRCGATTLTACPDCNKPIRGEHHISGFVGFSGASVPGYCEHCGTAYPWTSAQLETAREIAGELEGLTDEEREQLRASLDDLVRDTPRTDLAATRFRRLVGKARGEGVALLRASVTAIATEAAKAAILGPH
jgi:hypothetical protein